MRWIALLLALMACAARGTGLRRHSRRPPDPADMAAIRSVIQAQLQAFRPTTAPRHSPTPRRRSRASSRTPTPSCRWSAPATSRSTGPREVEFRDLVPVEGRWTQRVLVVGPDGVPVVAAVRDGKAAGRHLAHRRLRVRALRRADDLSAVARCRPTEPLSPVNGAAPFRPPPRGWSIISCSCASSCCWTLDSLLCASLSSRSRSARCCSMAAICSRMPRSCSCACRSWSCAAVTACCSSAACASSPLTRASAS